MNLQLSDEELAFQDEIRSFLATHWISANASIALMPGPRLSRATHRFMEALGERGWLAGQWPLAAGGAGWSDRERLLWEQEAAVACAPQTPYQGTDVLGPLLMRAGSTAQQKRHLPGIASGKVHWCQAFAEDSGALDLAQIETRAVPQKSNSGWRLTGGKPWVLDIPLAYEERDFWFYLLALTKGTAGTQYAEYSVFLLDARTPGLSIIPRPMIGEPPGQHAVHRLVLDDVQLDGEALLGPQGKGAEWAAQIELSELTRPGMVARNAVLLRELRNYIDPATELANKERPNARAPDGDTLWEDDDFRARLHALEVELSALRALEIRAWDTTAEPALGAAEPPFEVLGESAEVGLSALRLGLAERIEPLNQKLADLQVDALGYFALPYADFSALDNEGPIGPEFAQPALLGMLSSSARAAIGAPREHLKNIIAKSVLALPETTQPGHTQPDHTQPEHIR